METKALSPRASTPPARSPGRLSGLRIAELVLVTMLLVALLGRYDPFATLIKVLWKGGEGQQFRPRRATPTSGDMAESVTLGGDLLRAFRTYPPPPEDRASVLFMGNSQLYAVMVLRDEHLVPDDLAETATQVFGGKLEARAPGRFFVHDAGAPNHNFAEELWQALYRYKVAKTNPPKVLILQASFDTFRKTGIRPGFQSLLSEPAFAAALDEFGAKVDQAPRPDKPYLSAFVTARKNYQDRQRELAQGTEKREFSLEELVRAGLEHIPLYHKREELKSNMAFNIYYLRVALLHITPTSRRHITGAPLEENFSALLDLIRLAHAKGTTVFLYNAPVNPNVSMFFEEEYRLYLERLRRICAEEGVDFSDLYDAVPKELWGEWIDGPDPIHVGEGGHRILGERFDAAFGAKIAAIAPSL